MKIIARKIIFLIVAFMIGIMTTVATMVLKKLTLRRIHWSKVMFTFLTFASFPVLHFMQVYYNVHKLSLASLATCIVVVVADHVVLRSYAYTEIITKL